MPFNEEIIERARRIAGHRCECQRISCEHTGRCTATESLEPHHIRPERAGGPSTLENCEVLCHDCHEAHHARHPVH